MPSPVVATQSGWDSMRPCDRLLALYREVMCSLLHAKDADFQTAASVAEERSRELLLTFADAGAAAPDYFAPDIPACVLHRVLRKLELSPKEALAFVWIVLHAVGESMNFERQWKGDDSSLNESTLMARVSGFTPSESLAFLNSARPHMEQGIIELSEGYNNSLSSANFVISREAVTTLLEIPVTQEEYMKVVDTAISEAVEEAGLAAKLVLRGGGGGAAAGGGGASVGLLAAEAEDAAAAAGAEEEEVAEEEEAEEEEGEEAAATGSAAPEEAGMEGGCVAEPYVDDLDYLSDRFNVVVARRKAHVVAMKGDEERKWDSAARPDSRKRELLGQERALLKTCAYRLAATPPEEAAAVRLEALKTRWNLNEFEVWVLVHLVATQVCLELRRVESMAYARSVEVGLLLAMHSSGDLREQMRNRRSFHKNGPLVRGNLITVVPPNSGTCDLNDCIVEMDRRMLDYCVGLDTEFSDLVDSVALYSPQADVENVVLPAALKKLVIDTVVTHERAKAFRNTVGFDQRLGGYGSGVVLLFHGPPGTGKTMMANALAHRLGKKVLAVSVPQSRSDDFGQRLRAAFREASIRNALLFFDECDCFLDGDRSQWMGQLLVELERYDGLMVMATNRPSKMDEAMYRRITLALEFPHPDAALRRRIWQKHIPEGLRTEGIDWQRLAEYELSGGYIKNAVMNAISAALARAPNSEGPTVTGADLEEACRMLVSERLKVGAASHARVTPQSPLKALVADADVVQTVEAVIAHERGKVCMAQQWGFTGRYAPDSGTVVVLSGAPGTGKTLAAEAMAFELSRPLQVHFALECQRTGDKTGGRGGAAAVFEQARKNNAVVLIEGFEALAEVDGGAASHIGFLARRFGGLVVIATTDTTQCAAGRMDAAFRARFEKPRCALRERMWRAFVPEQAPLDAAVDFARLAERYEFTGAQIKAALTRAATAACGVGAAAGDVLTQKHLTDACDVERKLAENNEVLHQLYQ